MGGWVPMDAEAWPLIAPHLPTPWLPEWAAFDLRWHADRGEGTVGHGRPFWVSRWGWTDWRVKALLRDEDTWRDPLKPRRQPTASPPPADRQPTASPPPAPGQADADNPSATASPPPARRQRSASGPPARRHTRGVHPTPSPSPTPSPEREEPSPPSPAPEPPPPPPLSRPRKARRGPLAEAWAASWEARTRVPPTLTAAHVPLLATWHELVGDDVALFSEAVTAFWTAFDRGQAWKGRVGVGLSELTLEAGRWLDVARAARARAAAPRPPPPELELPPPPAVWLDALEQLAGHVPAAELRRLRGVVAVDAGGLLGLWPGADDEQLVDRWAGDLVDVLGPTRLEVRGRPVHVDPPRAAAGGGV